MIVIDASALVEALGPSPIGEAVLARLGQSRDWHAPALVDLEVAQTLRRSVMRGELSGEVATLAVADLETLPLTRWDHRSLLARIWDLRHVLSAYDASYVALAEALDSPLLTLDRRLAASRGHRAAIEVVGAP